jgi:phytol kinase
MQQIANMFLLGGVFLLLFIVAEFLYHALRMKAELTRKIVHIGTGIITLLFPIFLANHWLVLVLCAGFFVLLSISLWFNFLKSINAIKRFSVGSLLYPCAVYFCYLVYDFEGQKLYFFYLPMLSLALCDPIAEIFGKNFPYKTYKIGSSQKSFGGSIAFFVSCFLLHIGYFNVLIAQLSFSFYFLIAMASIALFTAFVEGVSGKGIDNITIPIAVIIGLKIFGI